MSYSVLVAEDETPLADVLADILEDEGYQVRCVTDGEAAIKAVEASPPDLIISDISMPKMDGVEMAQQVLRRLPPIPLILMSARTLPQQLPGVVFVPKPFDMDQLLTLAEHALATSSHSTRPLP